MTSVSEGALQRCCISFELGSLSSQRKRDLASLVETNGGVVEFMITTKTTHVIVNEETVITSLKMKSAKFYGCYIVLEAWLNACDIAKKRVDEWPYLYIDSERANLRGHSSEAMLNAFVSQAFANVTLINKILPRDLTAPISRRRVPKSTTAKTSTLHHKQTSQIASPAPSSLASLPKTYDASQFISEALKKLDSSSIYSTKSDTDADSKSSLFALPNQPLTTFSFSSSKPTTSNAQTGTGLSRFYSKVYSDSVNSALSSNSFGGGKQTYTSQLKQAQDDKKTKVAEEKQRVAEEKKLEEENRKRERANKKLDLSVKRDLEYEARRQKDKDRMDAHKQRIAEDRQKRQDLVEKLKQKPASDLTLYFKKVDEERDQDDWEYYQSELNAKKAEQEEKEQVRQEERRQRADDKSKKKKDEAFERDRAKFEKDAEKQRRRVQYTTEKTVEEQRIAREKKEQREKSLQDYLARQKRREKKKLLGSGPPKPVIDNDTRKIFVGGIKLEDISPQQHGERKARCTREERINRLLRLFNVYGDVIDRKVVVEQRDKTHVFITYETTEMADKAVEAMSTPEERTRLCLSATTTTGKNVVPTLANPLPSFYVRRARSNEKKQKMQERNQENNKPIETLRRDAELTGQWFEAAGLLGAQQTDIDELFTDDWMAVKKREKKPKKEAESVEEGAEE